MGYSKNQNSYFTQSLNGRRSRDIVLHSKQKLSEPHFKRRESPSDLWIPREFVADLRKRISKVGTLKKVMHSLLIKNRYRIHTLFDNSRQEKTIYQDLNLKLVRFSFRPAAADWAEFRILARYYGVSICCLFVMILSLEQREGLLAKNNHSVLNQAKNGFQNIRITLVQKVFREKGIMSFAIFLESDSKNVLLTGS
ncbi:DUF1564 family protein [Leptospira sp. WS92.C1]